MNNAQTSAIFAPYDDSTVFVHYFFLSGVVRNTVRDDEIELYMTEFLFFLLFFIYFSFLCFFV